MPVQQVGVWGIDLGQCAVKAIRLENHDGEIVATAFDYIEHPKILSQPDADPEQLTREALEKFLERNKLKGDIVAISVPGEKGLARFVKLPPVEEKKINDIVRFEAKQQIPFPLDEVVWDFQKLNSGSVTDGYAMETEIGLFAMKREMVHRYLDYFKEVNVDVHVVQMAPLALVNFAAHDLLNKKAGDEDTEASEEKADGKACIVVMDIGADTSNLVITDGGRIIWQRPIPIGGNHFTRALTKDLKLTFAKAEHLKRNAVKSPDLKKILISLRPVLNDLVSEAQRSLGFFTNSHRDANIQYMIGLGNAFRLPGLQKFLQEKLQLEVRKLAKFQRLEGESVTKAPQFSENVMSFAVAYGLALQGLKQTRLHTNLLPKEIQVERVIRAKKPWAVAAVAALLVSVGLLTLAANMKDRAYGNPRVEAQLKDGTAVKGQASTAKTEAEKAEADAKASKETAERIAAGVDKRFNWNMFYQYINDALPRPDGDKLSARTGGGFRAREKYFDESTLDEKTKKPKSGKMAYEAYLDRRRDSARGVIPGADDAQVEEDIKKSLVSINIEGVSSFFVDNVADLFINLEKHALSGMPPSEVAQVRDKEKWPKEDQARGWVIEIRGYTYHYDGDQFIINTFLENLINPEAVGVGKNLGSKDEKEELKNNIKSKIKYVFLYKYKEDKKPQPGIYESIKSTLLKEALKPASAAVAEKGAAQPDGVKKGPGREAWVPAGKMAAASLTGSGGVAVRPPILAPVQPPGEPGSAAEQVIRRQPRTEFHLMFFWEEPLPPEPAQPAPVG